MNLIYCYYEKKKLVNIYNEFIKENNNKNVNEIYKYILEYSEVKQNDKKLKNILEYNK